MPALRDVIALLEEWYPPRWAEDWDAVGLVCGDPDDEVRAIAARRRPGRRDGGRGDRAGGRDLLVTHHPLLLRGVHGVAATTPKGRVVHGLVSGGCALYTAHTNADAPTDGVSESLALALGLRDVTPLEPAPAEPLDKLVVFVPAADADAVRRALAEAGAGRIGDYDSASFTSPGEGRFRPLDGATPAIGSVGELEVVDEVRVEVVAARGRPRAGRRRDAGGTPLRGAGVRRRRARVPTDEPARGHGRIGTLAAPMTLREFAEHVADVLPATAHGVRVAGDPDQQVRTVALCGGSRGLPARPRCDAPTRTST